jgi:hypothetical protein
VPSRWTLVAPRWRIIPRGWVVPRRWIIPRAPVIPRRPHVHRTGIVHQVGAHDQQLASLLQAGSQRVRRPVRNPSHLGDGLPAPQHHREANRRSHPEVAAHHLTELVRVARALGVEAFDDDRQPLREAQGVTQELPSLGVQGVPALAPGPHARADEEREPRGERPPVPAHEAPHARPAIMVSHHLQALEVQCTFRTTPARTQERSPPPAFIRPWTRACPGEASTASPPAARAP